MSLDLTATTEEPKTKGNDNHNPNPKLGKCPNCDLCKEYYFKSYYCNSDRSGVVINNKIVCYIPKNGNGQ